MSDEELDPHGLRLSGEALAPGSEVSSKFGLTRKKLRRLRIERAVRYIDQLPNLKPGRGAADRYLYAISDVERHIDEAEITGGT